MPDGVMLAANTAAMGEVGGEIDMRQLFAASVAVAVAVAGNLPGECLQTTGAAMRVRRLNMQQTARRANHGSHYAERQ
jgi:hypothetical protein